MPVFRKYNDNGIGYQKVRIEREKGILTAFIKTKVCKKQVNDQNNTFYPYYQLIQRISVP